jgi:hypothetical protein
MYEQHSERPTTAKEQANPSFTCLEKQKQEKDQALDNFLRDIN